MAHIDRLLKGKGRPRLLKLRPVEREIKYFDELIDLHYDAALTKRRGVPTQSAMGELLKKYKIIATIVVGLLGAMASIVVIYSFFKTDVATGP